MDQLAGKTAFVTGGASGIGYAMAKAFVAEGMNVAIADIDEPALAVAASDLRKSNVNVQAVVLDVTNRDQYAAVADQVEAQLGPVHVVCNNAGVYRGGSIGDVTYEDWDWIMGVNTGGVINGVQTFAARLKAHGQGGHIVNTASMAGITAGAGLGVYNASKFAVVGLSESMRADLAPFGIGVSVLCPGMVRTQILDSERNRPNDFEVAEQTANSAAANHNAVMQAAMASSNTLDADAVAELVVAGIKRNELYVFPHPEMRQAAQTRMEAMLQGFGPAAPERDAAQQQFMESLAAFAEASPTHPDSDRN
ncbi:MAG: SDR family NAD(P)-dependent oxidoreductase [Pseudomonadales bacterium]